MRRYIKGKQFNYVLVVFTVIKPVSEVSSQAGIVLYMNHCGLKLFSTLIQSLQKSQLHISRNYDYKIFSNKKYSCFKY